MDLTKYRLYIDEVGNHDLTNVEDERHRYLSLTGVVFEISHIKKYLFPELENLKSDFFNSHPDDPVILHRKELVNKKYPFQSLRDEKICQEFDSKLLEILNISEYWVTTVVIDKKEHNEKYASWRYDPYHYCLAIILERYVQWLNTKGFSGDVIAESRGGREDRRLKKSFSNLITSGTEYVESTLFQNCFTSKELKVKPKKNNIAGLQIADMIAHPSCRHILELYKGIPGPGRFGKLIAEILEESKYLRSKSKKILGYGHKILP
ncbi:MAG TPA: DUF3800 domain-containing protein [bacterium]